jgi:hypothetical protein
VKCQANQLITSANDLLVAKTAGYRKGEFILFRFFHQVQNPFEQVSNFNSLTIQALGQQHRELGRIDLQYSAYDSSIHPLGARSDQGMALLNEGASDEFYQVNRNHRHMSAAEDGDSPLPFVLQKR